MKLKNTEIADTFAEAFKMWGARVVITAENRHWATAAARAMTGFATSVIGCKCEAGIEREIPEQETLDGRPGVSILLFAPDAAGLGKRLVERIGQCVMTCPTTACFNGLDSPDTAMVGSQLRYFGDGFQMSKRLNGRRMWRIPVMDGEFLVDERFGVTSSVGGGNFLILGKSSGAALRAARAAVKSIAQVRDVVLPFPGGVVRSGSKVGSRYKALMASTNDGFCPTLRPVSADSQVPDGVNCVLEIVIDGLSEAAVRESMLRGIHAAAKPGIARISAGNYGGKLGQFHFQLHELLSEDPA